jgi:hypothetical protein
MVAVESVVRLRAPVVRQGQWRVRYRQSC